jgi:cardiolipin synthase
MLAAIDGAVREILLEMYWIGNDVVGATFRDRLAAKAAAGVAVYVIYDAVGSFGLHAAFWSPLLAAGGRVAVHGTLAPWHRRFRFTRLRFRDHRKLLIVDGEVGFCGGINLGVPWLPRNDGGGGWRDDAIEVHGVAALELRDLACGAWRLLGSDLPSDGPSRPADRERRTAVLANRVDGKPNRRIRRAYLVAIRRARKSIDIASAYFLPGPMFLQALRKAVKRGIRVRVLIPKKCDVWLVGMAMVGIIDKLLRDGVEVLTYDAAMLHSKTVILDGRMVVIGSHNLDTLSWRFNLEANVVVDDAAFATAVLGAYECDIASSTALARDGILDRSILFRVLAWLIARFRVLL